MEIHPVGVGQAAEILEVYRQCEDFLALGPQPQASLQMVLDDLMHSAAEGGQFCGIWNPRGKIACGKIATVRMVGVVDYVPEMHRGQPGQAFISLLMIARPYRSQGLGALVVRRVEAEVTRNGRVEAILSAVQTNNPGAIRFWERQGYRVAGGPETNPDGTTVFHLRKDIPPRKFKK